MGTAFEGAGITYAAIDLDWLMWFDAGWSDEHKSFAVMLRNLEAVVGNYLDAGVRYVVMALTIEHKWQLDRIRAIAPPPLHVVRLEASIETIRVRLSVDPTESRKTDLERAEKAVTSRAGAEVADHTIRSEGRVLDLVDQVLEAVGWNLAD
jgi:hypothetical protein